MTLNGQQLIALIKVGLDMAKADGRVADEETTVIAMELGKFGVKPEVGKPMLAAANAIDSATAIGTLAFMTVEQMKYATGFLAAVMAADAEIADAEIAVWKVVCTLAGFPTMTFGEALNFWKSN